VGIGEWRKRMGGRGEAAAAQFLQAHGYTVLAQNWRAVTPAAWAGLVFSSIGALVVAYLIWYRGVQRLGPSRTAFYSNVTPVVAMLTAWIALGETPTPWQVVGAGGIFGGLYLTRT